jgi:oligopeptide transport system permease protein
MEYVTRRLIAVVPVWAGVSLIVFALLRIAPGGPFDQERELPPEVKANLLHQYGLDKPLWEQYWIYVFNAARADFGVSFRYKELTVRQIIAERFLPSLELGSTAMVIVLLIGIPLGIVAAVQQRSWVDYLGMAVTLTCYATPPFVIALVFILLFAVTLHLLPVSGWGGLSHFVLPATVLGIGPGAVIARLTRGGMLEVLRQDYTRTARAKGLQERAVVLQHVLKNALIPVITTLGLQASYLITGSIVIEYIFSVPGMGQLFVTSLTNRDYPLVMGVALFYATVILVANLVVDLCYSILDPRVRY